MTSTTEPQDPEQPANVGDSRWMPEWKRDAVKALRSAVIDAALPLTDDEIHGIVKAALISARRMLSS